MYQKLKNLIDERLVRPFRESHAPVEEMARASVVGLFWALTPLIGIQMGLVTITWFAARLVRWRFNLAIGVVWVWITNPVTMPFFYYGFYVAGVLGYKVLGIPVEWVSFASLEKALVEAQALPMWDGFWMWGRYMVYELGLPMLIGGFLCGLPLAILGYPITKQLVIRYRTKQARALGLSLVEWEQRFVVADAGEPAAETFAHAVESLKEVAVGPEPTETGSAGPQRTAKKKVGKSVSKKKSKRPALKNKPRSGKPAAKRKAG